jgi:hypothetical protein
MEGSPNPGLNWSEAAHVNNNPHFRRSRETRGALACKASAQSMGSKVQWMKTCRRSFIS